MKINKRVAVALLGGLAVAGVAGASAATLGDVTSDSLGSGDGIVGSCDSDGVEVDYSTEYDASTDVFEVTGVTVGAVNDDCEDLDVEITLRDGAGDEIGSGSGTVTFNVGGAEDAQSFDVDLDADATAEDVEGISIVISG